MVKFTFTADTRALEIINRQLDALPEQIQRAVDRTTQTAQPARDEVARYPGAVKYPIQWTSEKQRRAFFATNGFGAGIPYRRTGGLGQAWNLTSARSATGAVLVLENRAASAKYVYGFFGQPRPQQGFHVNTGWQTIANNNPRVRIQTQLVQELIANILLEIGDV
jgi:hypothetical protein